MDQKALDKMTVCHFLDREQFRIIEAKRMALAKSREADPKWLADNKASYGWAQLKEVTEPCPMWYAYWFFDLENPEHKIRRDKALAAIADGTFGTGEKNYYLSRHYWTQWSGKRSPICVLCPNGAEWCVDAKSSNGDGWIVIGEPPLITCSPSIQVPGYHGHLVNGIFKEA